MLNLRKPKTLNSALAVTHSHFVTACSLLPREKKKKLEEFVLMQHQLPASTLRGMLK